MENIVTFCVIYITLFESPQALPAGMCTGRNGTSCCTGFRWDHTLKKCLPCERGYAGPNCEIKCPFPSYGVDCQMKCDCIDKACDPVNGCKRSTTACERGYAGPNCEIKCPFPSYGVDCQMKCDCIDKDCDPVNGCKRSTTGYPIHSSLGLDHKMVTTKSLESKYSICKSKLYLRSHQST